MKTREMSYKDYGISRKEEIELKNRCKKMEQEECRMLFESAISANPDIFNQIYYSLAEGCSYDELRKIHYIPISKVDFYGYQRKCLYKFKNLLLLSGKLK